MSLMRALSGTDSPILVIAKPASSAVAIQRLLAEARDERGFHTTWIVKPPLAPRNDDCVGGPLLALATWSARAASSP